MMADDARRGQLPPRVSQLGRGIQLTALMIFICIGVPLFVVFEDRISYFVIYEFPSATGIFGLVMLILFHRSSFQNRS